jgi:hypothetical protein
VRVCIVRVRARSVRDVRYGGDDVLRVHSVVRWSGSSSRTVHFYLFNDVLGYVKLKLKVCVRVRTMTCATCPTHALCVCRR